MISDVTKRDGKKCVQISFEEASGRLAISNRIFSKQTVETLIRCCVLQRQIRSYTVCLCLTKMTLRVYGFKVQVRLLIILILKVFSI